jgi:hypothetical protein
MTQPMLVIPLYEAHPPADLFGAKDLKELMFILVASYLKIHKSINMRLIIDLTRSIAETEIIVLRRVFIRPNRT